MIGIVDGRNLCFRALVGGEMRTTTGIRTEIPFIMLKVLSRAARDHGITSFVVCWEGGNHPRRMGIHPEYKRREPSPEGLLMREAIDDQQDLVHEMLDALGVLQLQYNGLEADDLVAWCAKSYSVLHDVMIISTDKDFYTLVTDKVNILRSPDKPVLSLKNYESEVGVANPTRYQLIRSIDGDPGDNIQGIPGVGWSTAYEIVAECNSLEEIHTKLQTATKMRHRKVIDNWAHVLRNYELLSFKDNDVSPQAAAELGQYPWPNYNDAKVLSFLVKTQMNSVLANRTDYLGPFGWRQS